MSEFELQYLISLGSQEVGFLTYSMIGAQFAIFVGIYWLRRGDDESDPLMRHASMFLYTLFAGIVSTRTLQVFGDLNGYVLRLLALAKENNIAVDSLTGPMPATYASAFLVVYGLFWVSTVYLLYVHDFNKSKGKSITLPKD